MLEIGTASNPLTTPTRNTDEPEKKMNPEPHVEYVSHPNLGHSVYVNSKHVGSIRKQSSRWLARPDYKTSPIPYSTRWEAAQELAIRAGVLTEQDRRN